MTLRLTEAQSASLARQIAEHPNRELEQVALGTAGEVGPLLIRLGEAELLIEEDGSVDSDPHGVEL